MKATEKTPALRFRGFDGDWTTSTVADVTTYVDYRGKTPPKSESGVFLVTAKNVKVGHIDYECSKEYIPKELYDEAMRRGRPRLGDVLITTEAPLGNVATIDRIDIALAQRIIKLRAKEGMLSNRFLKHILLSHSFQKLLTEKSTGSTAKGIKGSVLHKLPLVLPSIAEQQKIGAFLSAMDVKVAQLDRKHELLLKYKKGVMRQIFEQKIRFKDDNGNDFPDWEESTLGAVGQIVGGGTPETEKPEYWGGNISWFTPTEIKSKYIRKSSRTLTEEGLRRSSATLLPKGTLLLSSRATVGEVGIAVDQCCTNQGFQSIIVSDNNVNEFLYYWLTTNRKELLRKANGSTFLEISKSEIVKIPILLPSKPEQSMIAEFLSSIDDKISFVNGQLEGTRAFKKDLLQQMFV